MTNQTNKSTTVLRLKQWTLRINYLLLILFATWLPTNSFAASSGFDTADSGLFCGNSQCAACGGFLTPLQNFLWLEGQPFTARQLTGGAVFSLIKLPSQIPYDVVALPNREEDWNHLGYQINLSYAANLHRQIVGQGARTALNMTYLIGYGPTKNLNYRRTITQYWRRLETDLENITVNGTKHDVLLIPVLELWELGRSKYPFNQSAPSCSYQRGFQTDRLHATSFGQYAVGILFATFLNCEDPRPVNDNVQFPEAYKKWARDTAWSLLNSSYRPDHC